ncbi:MAG: sulfatase-like hydrolase/transferase [Kiritimatiellaeota bacterium]|nr:sulfatase-like hydrolase/transferase [Kiritimatiellota bacterium]
MSEKLNIILIITDTFRFDNLFDRAKRPVRTPCLDAFAENNAVEMLNFYTGSFPTIPHRTDVITGRLGWPRYGWQALADSSANALPIMLEAQGYATQLICDCPHLFNSGFQCKFQAAFQHRGQEGDKPLLHLNDEIKVVQDHTKTRTRPSFNGKTLADTHRWMNRYFQYEDESFNYKTASTTVRWLEENSEAGKRSEDMKHDELRPFFLWVDFFDPHEPWDSPEYLVRRYQEEYDGEPMIHPNYGRSDVYTDNELLNLWAHYAAESEMVDRGIGRILQKIDDLGLWDDSVVVVTADHGTAIGEHGCAGKGNINDDDDRRWPLYPEISHVPFLIAAKGLNAGSKRKAVAQPIDIAPTLCDLAGVELHAPEPIEGRSFASALTGEKDELRKCAVSSPKVDYDAPLNPKMNTPFVTDGKWGCVLVGPNGEKQLFDLEIDPFAENDVSSEFPEKMEEMCEMFREHMAEFEGGENAMNFWMAQQISES